MSQSEHPSAKELVRLFVETLGGPRPGEILNLFAEDAWVHTTGSSSLSGRRRPRELLGLLKLLGEVVPKGVSLEIRHLIGEGDQAACEVQGKATTADGRPYNNHYVFWVHASEGRITLLSEFMDTRLIDAVFGSAVAG